MGLKIGMRIQHGRINTHSKSHDHTAPNVCAGASESPFFYMGFSNYTMLKNGDSGVPAHMFGVGWGSKLVCASNMVG